jgi:repressor LexA
VTAAPTLPALTPVQARVLAAVRSYITDRGYAPTVREICAATGLSSKSGVVYQLSRLAEKGYIRRDPETPRAIVILAPPETR